MNITWGMSLTTNTDCSFRAKGCAIQIKTMQKIKMGKTILFKEDDDISREIFQQRTIMKEYNKENQKIINEILFSTMKDQHVPGHLRAKRRAAPAIITTPPWL